MAENKTEGSWTTLLTVMNRVIGNNCQKKNEAKPPPSVHEYIMTLYVASGFNFQRMTSLSISHPNVPTRYRHVLIHKKYVPGERTAHGTDL